MRSGVLAAFLLGMSALLPTAPVWAQSFHSDRMQPAPDTLRPGQFVWYEQPELIRARTAIDAPISIVVSLPSQRAYVYRGSMLVGVSTVSTGSRGHETPVGQFTILQKNKFHRSNIYSNAPMPFMQRLTWTGIALHAGHLPGYPASHGCIRLPKAFARDLFDMTRMGGAVSVIDSELPQPAPERFAPPPPLLVADARNLGGDAFDVVTMRVVIPRTVTPGPSANQHWRTGPYREIVQPLPPGQSR